MTKENARRFKPNAPLYSILCAMFEQQRGAEHKSVFKLQVSVSVSESDSEMSRKLSADIDVQEIRV